MAGLTSDIERFLKAMLEETQDGMVEIGRNDLASRFSCSPSQINYVLSTRFTPYNGYIIESKRGGNGFIKIITIVEEDQDDYIYHVIKNLDEQMTESMAHGLFEDLYNRGFFTRNEVKTAEYAVSEKALINVDKDKRNLVRRDIIESMLLSFLVRS
ncbi:MAG: CtsR family transcriptional regulator [Peptoniphilaceae bacterium]|nr:CtsR family transcriptional regulator [Peptoniphilaceae bacterium]MDY6018349.1 CtsR family transcriptional regulator [Anaerococcus sp.]